MTSATLSNNAIIPGFDDQKEESLRIRLQRIDGTDNCLALYLTGYLDTYNCNYLQKMVAKALEAGYTRLIFDLGGMSYISSTGIGSFTHFLKATKQSQGDIILLNIQPKVFDVFRLLGFSQFFNIKESLDEAILHFHGDKKDGTQTFPLLFDCPICSRKLKAVKAGRFRCSECKTIIAIKEDGTVLPG